MTQRAIRWGGTLLLTLLTLTPAWAQSQPATTPATATAPAIRPKHAITPGKIIQYRQNQRSIDAYLVSPKADGPFPAVLLVHDIYGITPFIRQQADALAAQGYVVLVPNLYSDQQLPEGAKTAHAAYAAYEAMTDRDAMRDLRAALDHLAAQKSVAGPDDDKAIAVVGIDMGGIYAIMLPAIDLRVKAAVNYYGRLLYPRATPARPISPVELATNLKVPLLSFYGHLDPQIPDTHVQRLEKKLAHNPNRIGIEIIHYDNVGHGFLDPSRQGHNPQAATDAQARTLAFLARVLTPDADAGKAQAE